MLVMQGVEVVIDGIEQSTTDRFCELLLRERVDEFGPHLLEWSNAQRLAQAPGVVCDEGTTPKHLRAAELPSREELRPNGARKLLIYTWGLAVIRAGQLPTGAEDSQATYDASVLTARKHGVTGRAQLANMNGFDPVLQEVLCADFLFPGWLRDTITDIEANDRTIVSVVCAHGQHRSVAAAEIMKAVYYPAAEIKHLTMHN